MMGSLQLTDAIEAQINGLFVMTLTPIITAIVAPLMFRSRWGVQGRAVVSNRIMAGASASTPGRSIEMRAMSLSDAPCDCSQCGVSAPRVLLTAPAFSCMPASRRVAHATNERASHAPMSLDQFKAKRRGAGCSCCAPRGKGRLTTTPTGERGFPTARPWMISH
jgi:hypothetical protein